MKIRTVRYMFNQGFTGLWRNKNMSLASISSVAASLMILGLIITLVLNINNVADLAQMQFDTIQVFLEEDISQQKISEIGNSILKINDVNRIEYESKEQALLNMKESWGEQGYLLDTLEENYLPNSYIIYLNSIDRAEFVVGELATIDGIDMIKYHQEIIDTLLGIASFIKTVGLALILVLILIAMFIISNTIRLALNARRQEINIMKYVGATNWFIRWPFILEGIILGLLGAIIALLITYYGYNYAYSAISNQFTVVFSAYLIPIGQMMNTTIIMFIVIGSGVGALGSIVSLRKHLRV
ncbi:permease-like cell division protein FtsX [Alkaliphilus peptidifermentans]|uniref:Cell division protein FtsX n=1 Tax=Alkaliphilus peptidifermentans DSM 18978 TaxID=1120976 RepID=A0A1G5GAF7_9FIRM|nr:permease-like cell division protein FtsX [Alkaliphilus peptidifermentans]SCY48493.1 cell division protein FtsX [Alkaliphilus peptidifermentans DSM 18978]